MSGTGRAGAAVLLVAWLALGSAGADSGPSLPAVRGQASPGQRGADIVVSKLPSPAPGEIALTPSPKPTLGRLRASRALPAVSPPQQAVGPASRQRFQEAGTTSGETVVLAGFEPADAGPSPAPSAGFQGVLDDATAYNPDTAGAVGTNHIMTATASAVQVLTRAGTPLSLTTLSNFWSNLGTPTNLSVYDPRLLYDARAQRWIHTAAANPGLTNPGLLLAVSQTSDPTAAWYRYFLPTDAATDVFADSPNLGLNRDSIVISANMFARTNYSHVGADVFVLRKAVLYGGASTPEVRRFSLFATNIGSPANVPVPAVAFDDTLTTNYLVGNWNGLTTNGGFLAVYTLSTNNGALELNLSAFSYEPPVGSPAWDTYSPDDDNFAPQAGTTNRIYLGDARVGNVVFRVAPDANTMFLAQTIFLPAGGAATRAAVQWWEITINGVVLQRGRIEDTATGRHFAYPSIAVNRRYDVLVGYSRFGATQFPSANYSFRIDADLFSSLRGDAVLKAGEAKFYAPDSFGLTHWGDWSATVVDPNDDTDLWTLQEYASTPIDGTDRWGTWWGRVSPPSDLSVLATDSPDPVVAGSNVTYSVTVITTNNKIQRVTGVRLQATLPPGAVFVSATPSQGSCGLSNNLVQCDFGTVGDVGRATASLVLRHLANGSPAVNFSVSANGPELTPLNNALAVTTTVLPAADISVSANASPNPVTVSNQLAYSLLITNAGPNSATTLQLTNILPPNVTFLAASPSQGACSQAAGIITCNLGTVPPLGTATVQITARPLAPGNLTNRASVGSAAIDLVPGNNSWAVTSLANAAPTLGFISDRSINEDSVLGPIAFTVGDLETPAGSLTLTGFCSNPAIVPNGNISFGGSGSNRTVTIFPAPNANGTVSITRIVTDALGASATNSFLLSILPVNDAPTISALGGLSLDEDSITNAAFTINDIETPAAILTLLGASSNPALIPNASLVFGGSGANRTVNLAPAANQSGSSTITITVSDGTNTASTAFLVTVREVNDPPTITGLANRTVPEDTSTGPIAFTVGDVESSADTVLLSGFSGNPILVPHTNLVFGGAGANRTLTVLPGPDQSGVVTLFVVATDTNNARATNSFVLTITGVNDPPTLGLIPDRTINENVNLFPVVLTGISPGPGNEVQAVVITATSSNPALLPSPTVSYSGGATGLLFLTPAPFTTGTATITVTATDDGGTNNVTSRTFNVTVVPVNDPPTVSGLSDRTLSEDTTGGPFPFTVGDPESAATTLTLSGTSSDQGIVPNSGILFSGTGSNRFVTVIPAANANGSCRIFVTVSDGEMATNASFLLTVLPVNDPPTLAGLAPRTLDEDATTSVGLIVGDLESAASTLTVAASSSNPGLAPSANLILSGTGSNRTLTITPAANQFGSATITVQVTDPNGGSTTGSLLLTVNPVNDPPTIAPVAEVVLNEDAGPQAVPLTGISSGAPNEIQTLSFSASSSLPNLVPTPTLSYTNGSTTAVLRFTPVTNAFGDAVLVVTADDGALSNRFFSRSITVRIRPVNDLPTLVVPGPQTMFENTTLDLSLFVTDAETPGGVTLTAFSSNPELLADSGLTLGGTGTNRTLSIRPLVNSFGFGAVILTATDSDGGTTTATIELQVLPNNAVPSITAIANLSLNEDTVSALLPFTVQDRETSSSSLVVTGSSSNPVLIPSSGILLAGTGSSRTVRILPATNQSGVAVITLSVSDGVLSSSTSFQVTVQPVNDLPVLGGPGLATTPEDTALSLPIYVNDVEGLTGLRLAVTASNPTLFPTNRMTLGGTGTNRSLLLLPATNLSGTAQIVLTLTDVDGASVSNEFSVVVTPVDDPPLIAPLANVTMDEDTVSPFIPVTVNDPDTLSLSVAVTVTSSNPILLPPGAIRLAGRPGSRTLQFLPPTNQFGMAQVTLFASDGSSTTSNSLQLTVQPVNDRPNITGPTDQTLDEDTGTGPLAIVVSDVDNAVGNLTLTAASSEPALVPPGNIVLGGSGSNRTVTVTPATNASGTCTILLTVSDGQATASSSFLLTVRAVNDRPTVTAPASVLLSEDGLTNLIVTLADAESPAASLLLSAASSNPLLLPADRVVVSGTGATRSVSLAPAADQFGSATVLLTVSDPEGASNVISLAVTVAAVNDPPTLDALNDVTLPEDAGPPVVVLTGLGMGAANEGQTLALTAVSSAPSIVPNPVISYTNGSPTAVLRYTLVTNAFGNATITVTVNDGGLSNHVVTRSFLVRVLPVNDLPVLGTLAAQTMLEDTTLVLGLFVDDAEGASLVGVTATCSNPALMDASGISVTGIGTNRTLSLRPLTNAFGTAQITVVATDGEGAAVTNSFALQVQAVNDAPTLSPLGNLTLIEDTPSGLIPFTVGDVDTNAAALVVTATSSNPTLLPPAGLVLAGTGNDRTLRLLPATNQNGTVIVTVAVSDGFLATSNSFQVIFQPVNDPPTISDVTNRSIDEDTTTGPMAFVVGDVETPAGSLTASVGSSDLALVPLANIVLGGTGANRTVQVTPAANRSGTATITLQVTDAEGGVASDAFVLSVNPINDPPTLAAIPDLATNEDSGPLIVGLSGISAGPLETQALTITAASSNPTLIPSVAVNYSSPATLGSLVFTPAPNGVGSAIITVTVRDDGSGSNSTSRSFTVTVNPVNDPPTLDPIANRTLAEDSPSQVISLSGISAGPVDEVQALVLSAVSSNPSVIPNPVVSFVSPGPGGSLQFTPVPNAFGSSTITVTVAEAGGGLSVQRSFTVTVTNVNDAPVLTAPAPVFLARSVPTNVTVTVADIDDAVGTLVLSAASSNPTLLPVQNLVFSGSGGVRNLAIIPVTNRFGTAQITLTVTDPAGGSSGTNFTVTVSSTGLPPTLSTLANLTSAEDTLVNVSFTLGDFETPATGLMVTATSSNLALLPAANLSLGGTGSSRTLTALPRTNQTGVTLITLTVFDPEGLSATNSFVLTVTNINDLPSLSALPNRTLDEDGPTGPIPFTVGDIESPESALVVVAQTSNPGLVPAGNVVLGGAGANRTLAIAPLPDQSGTATITLQVTDPDGGSTNRSFTVTVNPVNDPPTLNSLPNLTLSEDAGPQSVSLSGLSAGGGETQTLTVSATSSNTTLIPNPVVSYASPQSTGTLTFTPVANAIGTTLITVTVNDGGSNGMVTRSFVVTVNPINDGPSISPIPTQQTAEDTPLTVAFLVGDPDTLPARLLVTASAADASLFPATSLLISGVDSNRTLTLTPLPDRFGTTTVTVAVSDGVASNVTSFAIRVVAVNDPPTLTQPTNLLYSVTPGALTLPITGIGSGAANETETGFSLSTTNSFPSSFWQAAPVVTYSGGSTGVLSFRPASNQTGTGTLAVIVNDGLGSNNITVRTFLLAIRPNANTQPFLSAIGPQSVNEDVILGPLNFTIGDAATPASSLVVSVSSANESVIPDSGLVLGGSGSSRSLTIIPAPNASGSSIISLLVMDSGFAFTNLSFVVTVNPVNDPPTLTGLTDRTVTEDATDVAIPFSVVDVDTWAGSLVLSAASGNTNLVPAAGLVLGGSGSNRVLFVSLAPQQSGTAQITVSASDGNAVGSQSFTLTVTPSNDPPSLSELPDLTLPRNGSSGPLAVLVADVDNDPALLTLSAASSNPVLLPPTSFVFGGSGPSRTLTINPAANQSGTATVTVTVSDGIATATDTFVVTVSPGNLPPTLAALADVSLNQGAAPIVITLAGISAGGSEVQPLIVAASSGNPALVPHPAVTYTSPATTGSLTLQPAAGLSGTALITVTVSDGQATNALVIRTFLVTVNGAPTLSPLPNQVLAQGLVSPPLAFTVRDPETVATSLTLAVSSSNPTLIPASSVLLGGAGTNRTLTLAPLAAQSGFATLTVTATDPQGNSSSFSFLLTVVPVLEPPRLAIELAAGRIVVSWSASAGTNWGLLVSTNLADAAGWRLAPETPVLVGDRYRVTNSLAGPRKFYRLCQGCAAARVLPAAPTLSLARTTRGLVLTWPAEASLFILESRDGLGQPWVEVPGTPVETNGQFLLNLPGDAPLRIFRLRLRE